MSISEDAATPDEITKSLDKVRGLMEALWQALDSLCEGVAFSAADDVRQLLSLRAGVVPLIDARLATCGDLLRKGLRSEALGRAAEAPRLVETAELLDLSRHKNWSAWQLGLSGQEMPEPVMPRVDLVAALKRAGDEVQRLKPLLDRWRRLNLTNGSLPDKIKLLRKLRKADPANDVWKESLQEHENQRLMQIERDIKQAVRDRDEPWLEKLVQELAAPWVEAMPTRLRAAATAALDSFRGSRIDREIDDVWASLAAAHEARDLAAARELRRRWQPLADEKGAADPGDARLAAAAPAVAWVDNHDRMGALSAEIWQSLDAHPRGLNAWRAWVRSLERMGAEMEDLAEKLPGEVDVEAVQRGLERIGRKQAELRQHEAFRRKLMYIATGSVAVLLAAVVVIISNKKDFDKQVAAAKAQLDKLLEECQGGFITESPDFAEKWSPAVLAHPDVVGRLASLSGCLKTENDRRDRFAERLTEAKTMTDAAAAVERIDPLAAWPEEFAKATRAVEEIARQSLAKSVGEQGDVERARGAILGLEKKWTAAADLDLERQAAAIDAAIDEARQSLAGDMAAAEARAAQARADIEAARSRAETLATTGAAEGYAVRRVASPAMVAKFGRDGPLARKAGELQRLIADRSTFAREVAKMPGVLGRWREYAQLLDGVAGTYKDVPQAANFQEAAQRLPQWEAVAAWNEFVTKLPALELCTPKQAKDVIAGFNALPQAARDLPMGRRFAADVIQAMEGFEDRDLQFLRENLQVWFAGTFQGELAHVVTDAAGRTYYCLEPAPAANEKFEYVTNWQGDGWVKKKSTVEAVTVKASPQASLAGKIEGQFNEGAIESGLNLDDRLMRAIEQSLAATDLDPLVQLVAAYKYSQLASTYSRPVQDHQPSLMGLFGEEGLPGGLTVQELTTFVNPDRTKDAAYLAAVKTAKGIVKDLRDELPKLAQEIAAERARLAGAKGDVPQLVGAIMLGAGGSAAPVWLAGKPKPNEQVWWISSATEFVEAGRIGADGSFKPAAKHAPAGTPLWRIAP